MERVRFPECWALWSGMQSAPPLLPGVSRAPDSDTEQGGGGGGLRAVVCANKCLAHFPSLTHWSWTCHQVLMTLKTRGPNILTELDPETLGEGSEETWGLRRPRVWEGWSVPIRQSENVRYLCAQAHVVLMGFGMMSWGR